MHASALNLLEFDKVVEAVASYALTPLGAASLHKLHPLTDESAIRRELAITTEGVRFLAENGGFELRSPRELDQILHEIAIESQALSPTHLLQLATFVESVEGACKGLAESKGGPYPALSTIAKGCANWGRECTEIRRKLDSNGQVADDASPELRIIRSRLARQRNRLRGNLESYLRGRDTAKYLQEKIVTERNGRFVLVVRSEHRAAIPGILHGSSSSGASLFLEPLSTVDLNNEIVSLEEKEHDEIRRVLLLLSSMFRRRASDLRRTLLTATEVDSVQARAAFSRATESCEPQVVNNQDFELKAARHPLLMKSVLDRLGQSPPERSSVEPVPINLAISPPTQALIVTGPNTGGKTVALKTAGLLVLMTQAGLHIPAERESRVPVFRTVFADIGDEQSIASNLSTFSGHIANIVTMDRLLALPALVLLDEIGAGTDPVEGSALGRAVIGHFRERGAHIIATTHDDSLKSYAATTAGVTCAAFGFDPDTFAPTYRLAYGSTGRSLALEIAGRLGLDSRVIEAAAKLRGNRETQLADHLAQLEQDRQQLNELRDTLHRQETELTQKSTQLSQRETKLQQQEQQTLETLKETLNTKVRSARKEIDSVISTLRNRATSLEQRATQRAAIQEKPLSTGDHGTLRAETHDALTKVVDSCLDTAAVATTARDLASEPSISIGAFVKVTTLGIEGTVISMRGADAEVEVDGKRLQVALKSLEATGQVHSSSEERSSVEIHVRDQTNSLDELNLIGYRVDDALLEVEKHLDQVLMSEQRTVRFIHGHGTGQLRQAIGGYLQAHPLIKQVSLAPPEAGGSGVTIAELRD